DDLRSAPAPRRCPLVPRLDHGHHAVQPPGLNPGWLNAGWMDMVQASPRRRRRAARPSRTPAEGATPPNPAQGDSDVVGSGWTVVRASPAVDGRNLLTSSDRCPGRKPA